MASIAVLIDKSNQRVSEEEFRQFAQRVAAARQLTPSYATAMGYGCAGAKLDSDASLHPGVTTDPASGSWLIAAGTVIDTESPSNGNLAKLLRDYVMKGTSVLRRLDGVFSLAIYNGRSRTLAVVSDPFGFFSMFLGERDGCVFAGTSALAVAHQVHAGPSELGIQTFLHTGKVFGEMTLWREVKRLRAATVIEFGPEGKRESVYWTPTIDQTLSRLSLPDAVDATARVLPSLLQRNLGREGKVWSDLTGGFDTRFLDVLLERARVPFKANFVGPDDHPDVKIAKVIAQRTNWEHEHFNLPSTWAQDAPDYIEECLYRGDGHLNVFLMLRPIWVHHREREQYGTLLTGLGGEMWRGIYWWPERMAIGRTTSAHYERQLWSLMHPIPDNLLIADGRGMVQDELTRQFRMAGERSPEARNTFKLDSVWLYRETSHTGAWTSCAAGLLRVVPPMFSKDIVTFLMSLDYRWRVNNSLVKHLLKRYRPELAEVEVEGRGPAEPLTWNNAHRFVPSRLAWTRKAVDKVAQVGFGKSFGQRDRPVSYSRLDWRRELVQRVAAFGALETESMRSGPFYHPNQLDAFLSDAKKDSFKHEEFLGRIITVELALRETEKMLQHSRS